MQVISTNKNIINEEKHNNKRQPELCIDQDKQ